MGPVPTRQSHGGCRRQGRLPTQDPAPLLGGGGWSTGHPRPEASPGPLCATAEVLNLFCFPHLQPRGDLASAVPPATEGRARRVCPGAEMGSTDPHPNAVENLSLIYDQPSASKESTNHGSYSTEILITEKNLHISEPHVDQGSVVYQSINH